MFCSKCGNQIADDVAFCPQCGAATASQNAQQPAYQQPVSQQPAQPLQPELPMKWFKFQINFALWAGAILNAINAFSMLTGSAYGTDGEAELVYAMFKDLKTLDMACGIFLLALAAFGIYTRFQLAKFKKNGPTMLAILYAGVVVFDLVYVLGCSNILPQYVLDYVDFTTFYSAMAGSVVALAINITYFKKRAHLFVNE